MKNKKGQNLSDNMTNCQLSKAIFHAIFFIHNLINYISNTMIIRKPPKDEVCHATSDFFHGTRGK